MVTPSKKSGSLTPTRSVDGLVHVIRGQRVMLDADLAALYGTKRPMNYWPELPEARAGKSIPSRFPMSLSRF